MRVFVLAALAGLAMALSACAIDDTGTCCTHPDPAFIPKAETNPATGEPFSKIAYDAKFNCESGYCGSYKGSAAFCTQTCASASDCPSGYSCAAMLETDPASTFCVQALNACESP